FTGKLEKPQGQRNPKGFNYELYLKNKGIYNTMIVEEGAIKLQTKSGKGGFRPFQIIARWMDKTIDKYLVGDGKGLLKSMLIGQRGELPPDIRDTFSATGTAHIIAISGLHIGFIMAGLNYILKRFYMTRLAEFIIQSTILIGYCILIGAPASAVRATLMAIIYLGGYALNRPENRANSLALAAFIILLIKPGQLFDIGFQMSFAAVAGIILLSSRL